MKLINQIINDDAFSILKQIPNDKVDCIISDLPYGSTDLHWDKKVDLNEFWWQAVRVTHDNAPIILFGAMPFTYELMNAAPKGYFRHDLIWEKHCPVGFLNANRQPLRSHEQILVFCKTGGYSYNPQKTEGHPYYTKRRSKSPFPEDYHYGIVERIETINHGDRYPKSVIKVNGRHPSNWHPTQKPEKLIEFLMLSYTNPNMLVLDPFAGSCVVAKTAQKNKRKFICVEQNPNYCAKALEELNSNSKTPTLTLVA